MGRQALVTGATGFVGGHLIDALVEHGWRIRALVRDERRAAGLLSRGVELRGGRLEDPTSLRDAVDGVDTVFHLAAVTAARSAEEYDRANADGTRNLVAACASAGSKPRRLVYLSSYAAAGPARPGSRRRLDEPPAPLTAYGRTKLQGEREAGAAAAAGTEVVVVRAPVVYGPGDRALLPFFRLVRMGIAPAPGGSGRRLHLVFAPDLALALVRAADAPTGTYAVAEPVDHLWDDVARTIANALGSKGRRLPIPSGLVRLAAAATEFAGGLTGRAVPFNREKAEEMLAPAWVCDLDGSEILLPPAEATPLRQGIERTIGWYNRQGWL
jgi:dihydroflavonol-4-reductase